MYTDIAGTHGTLRNETRPTFNGSKISPSNASIRVDDGGDSEEGRLGALYVIQRIYTGMYRVPAAAGRFNQTPAQPVRCAMRKGAGGRTSCY